MFNTLFSINQIRDTDCGHHGSCHRQTHTCKCTGGYSDRLCQNPPGECLVLQIQVLSLFSILKLRTSSAYKHRTSTVQAPYKHRILSQAPYSITSTVFYHKHRILSQAPYSITSTVFYHKQRRIRQDAY